ncbi:MAG: penicillin-binding protein beta-lactamase class [Planctomycetota bacterium]|nr:penicillin-binding protein beta-lactamase class [Planctomycetota bacterium]
MVLDRRDFFAALLPLLVQVPKNDTNQAPVPPGEGDDAIVSALKSLKQADVPGLTAAIAIPGKPTRTGATGIRKAGSPEGFGSHDLVHLGSCTKAMTATMIATLVEQGKLAWTSTLAEVFPDVTMHADYRPVTLTQLLTHRASLPANAFWAGLGRAKSTTEQRREAMTASLKSAPKVKPGTKMLYSNLGYAIAGLMAETVAKTSWEDLMRECLFAPLGMSSAGFGPPGIKDKVDQPWGHSAMFGRKVPSQIDNPPVLGPAGTVHSTMADWAKFAELHLKGARGEATPILKPETFRILQTPAPGESYAMGWGVTEREWAGGTTLSHSGSNTQWFCTVWLAPKRNTALLSATNEGGNAAAKAADDAVGRLIKLAGL